MPNHPMAFNLALIVERLLTQPRGWEVEDLKRELAIADRTYRKYRRILTEEFQPFQSRDGGSLVKEVEVGPVSYLRLVGMRETGLSDSNFDARVAATHLTRNWFSGMRDTRIGEALRDLVEEFRSTLRDRSYLESSVFAALEKRLVVEPIDFADEIPANIDQLVSSIIYNREVEIEVADGQTIQGVVERLQLNRSEMTVRLENSPNVPVQDIVGVDFIDS